MCRSYPLGGEGKEVDDEGLNGRGRGDGRGRKEKKIYRKQKIYIIKRRKRGTEIKPII